MTEPFEPLGLGSLWAGHLLNQNQQGDPRYYANLIFGEDREPVGISFVMDGAIGDFVRKARSGTLGPWPCSFVAVGWTLRENFGYAARLVLGPDHGLVGISFRVWNNSSTLPLVLWKYPGEPLFYTGISCRSEADDKYESVERKYKGTDDRWDERKRVEWTLAPREKEDLFLPLRDLLVENFDPKIGKHCFFEFHPTLMPKGVPLAAHRVLPAYMGISAMVTKASLEIDPHVALKEATTYAKVLHDKR